MKRLLLGVFLLLIFTNCVFEPNEERWGDLVTRIYHTDNCYYMRRNSNGEIEKEYYKVFESCYDAEKDGFCPCPYCCGGS